METATLTLSAESLAERRIVKATPRWLSLAVSVVIHVVVIAIAIWFIRAERTPERPVPVEIVIENQDSAAEPPPPPPEPQTSPPQEREPEFEIPLPNLSGGRVATRTTTPERTEQRRDEPSGVPRPAPTPTTPQPFTFEARQLPGLDELAEVLPRQQAMVVPTLPQPRANLPAAPRGRDLTQTMADSIRAQVLQNLLINWRAERYRGAGIHIHVELLADGTFAFPYGRNDPWNPRGMISNYDRLLERGNEDARVLLEAIVRAMRAAQPLQLPPGQQRYPVSLDLSFRTGN